MQFENVCLESVGYVLPAEQVTSAAIEEQLADGRTLEVARTLEILCARRRA